ncbi:transcription elongation regulator 1-like protein isoform X2 [Erpetoichthys calabaricus]|uniref:transcription elongation regulator 1-like protein isoform X1 n=1 Tax=Erpetoichthys calabaricus TaxID=27687 RepID=UPI00109F1AD5|nr:transcription elongation regulator 1-like protein isoform X1 [Erpetoichthys calabaricus]XP_051778947.1 transcription elongation regulator 1-like protein isoform X2 [Erpetoichthys calabaricus]
MIPIPRLKGQPQFWQMNGEPPPWIWMIPAASGLYRIGGAPPPFIVSSPHPPPLLQAVAGWQLPCDPFLPLMPLPSSPEPVVHQFTLPNVQWEMASRPPVVGFQPSANMDLVPFYPQIYTSVLPPHFGKGWIEKRSPEYKVYLNNALTVDSTWITPEELRIFQRHEKPILMTNQVARSICRPATASRNFHTLLVTPHPLSGGCPVAIKQVGSNKRIALAAAAAAAMVTMESDASQGPSSVSNHPYRVLTLSPIKIPLLSAPMSGSISGLEGQVAQTRPTQVTRVTAVSAPAVTFMASDWMDQTSADKSLEPARTSCTGTFILHTDRKTKSTESQNKDDTIKMTIEEKSNPKDNRPVASTPVPGSPWCVVWTGDDRVFFFNPTIQLSVWEKPVDLKGRGDLNKIIEDPPHKRKKEASSNEHSSPNTEDVSEDHTTKIKRNKTEEPVKPNEEHEDSESKPINVSSHRTILPLEVRISHFREMLLERGVSAFSTWEKELHKIVFDPRYLLLSSEERKQVFEQFVKTRIKEEYKEKKSKLQHAKEEFRKLLEESKITPRSTFKEFADKYGRDQRFKQVQKKKDQEHFFNHFINILKKRDKENRLRLRKMR